MGTSEKNFGEPISIKQELTQFEDYGVRKTSITIFLKDIFSKSTDQLTPNISGTKKNNTPFDMIIEEKLTPNIFFPQSLIFALGVFNIISV